MRNNETGFTLLELMIAMAIASIVIAVIGAAYNVQTKIYTEQDKTAEMQQNIRAGIALVQREVRLAGYNPKNSQHTSCSKPGVPSLREPGIHTADKTSLGFSMDIDGDGKCDGIGENVTYSINAANKLVRTARYPDAVAIKAEPVADNMTNIDFVYIFSIPASGAAPAPTSTPSAAQIKDIVNIQVSLLARASTPDRKASASPTFSVPMPNIFGISTAVNSIVWGPYVDSIGRRVLTTTINCRNMGLE